MNITDCYIGNGMLCFVAEIKNLTDNMGIVYFFELNDGDKTIESLDYINGEYQDTSVPAGVGEKKTLDIWFSTDMMYLQGMNDLNRVNISCSPTGFSENYEDCDGTIFFPQAIHIDSDVDITPKVIYSNDSYRILCYGLSLRRDHTDALVLLGVERLSTNAYQTVYCKIDGDILVDGTKIFNNNLTSGYLGYFKEKETIRFSYGYSTTYDEMNVMHSNTKMPQTIELPLSLSSDYDKKGDIMPATNFVFDIDENGIGHLR